jgi:hypothetical protein
MNTPRRPALRHALTLTELLVVILIITALLAVAVPSFSSMLYSSEAAMAESQLQGAMRAGRDAALRAAGRDDTAVVFAYQPAPGGGRIVMIPCVHVTIDFHDLPGPAGAATPRDVFVPSASVEPVQLPRHWMIRGYAPVNSIGTDGIWYEGNRYGQRAAMGFGDWIFPETGFYLPSGPTEGRFRQTFMVRYTAGAGVIATSTGKPAMVFLPDQKDPPGFTSVGAEVAELRALRLSSPRRYVERVVSSTTLSFATKRALLNVDSPDMVTAMPVSALALYDETRMASALRARLDPTTGCLYKTHAAGADPTFVPVAGAGGSMTDDDAQSGAIIDQWIEGDTNLTGGVRTRRDGDEPEARLFTIDRLSGALRRMETQQ